MENPLVKQATYEFHRQALVLEDKCRPYGALRNTTEFDTLESTYNRFKSFINRPYDLKEALEKAGELKEHFDAAVSQVRVTFDSVMEQQFAHCSAEAHRALFDMRRSYANTMPSMPTNYPTVMSRAMVDRVDNPEFGGANKRSALAGTPHDLSGGREYPGLESLQTRRDDYAINRPVDNDSPVARSPRSTQPRSQASSPRVLRL
jgi:hypothetical protein